MNKNYFKYWGKSERSNPNESYHLLPYHCLDVVAVADIWLQKSAVLLKQTSHQIKKSENESKKIILFFIALHDLGKFDARFQNFIPSLRHKLQGDKYEVDDEIYNHGAYGNWYFGEEFFYSDLMKAVAGHHGFCDESIRFIEPDADEQLIELDQQARNEWICFCLEFLDLDKIPDVDNISILAGLCSVSDWIGSSMTNFTTETNLDLKTYYQEALPRAVKALNETGMLPVIQGEGFNFLFPHYIARGIQKKLKDLPIKAGLTIVEADTGSGKTEFSLSYASTLIKNGLADGIVFGLPTQATANGLFDRIGKAADKLFSDCVVTLAHSKAKYLIPDDNGFLQKSSKRAFLGSMSVATIDQILMGVLGIKHQFVRSFGTRKSVLILDEIHSFDAYMFALIENVLKGQHEAYSSVILLSATLPNALKEKLLNCYLPINSETTNNAYPLVTHVDIRGETTFLTTIEKSHEKTIHSKVWNSHDQLPTHKQCQQLLKWTENGAMVGVICNTVQDAQLLYSLISSLKNKTSLINIDLFHARFTLADRLKIEKEVLNNYGKNANRTGRLLIATQVIEQSLDLDFDVLVSQIAPIEFLMQRMGRLWRHERARNKTGSEQQLSPRTNTIKHPLFITLCPELAQVESNFKIAYAGSGFVYKNIRALYRTQKYIQEHNLLKFPICYRQAISKIYNEEAYDDEPIELLSIVETYSNEQDGSYYSAKSISKLCSKPLNDVDPRAALLTREGEMSQTVVLLKHNGELWHGGDYKEQQDREKSTVSLSKKLAAGKKDENNYCLKAMVGRDVLYSKLGIYEEYLTERLKNLVIEKL